LLRRTGTTPVFFASDVPHFKEILVMSTVCDKCGWRNSEAKPASGIETEGVEIDLHVTSTEDLNRDVIKVFWVHFCFWQFRRFSSLWSFSVFHLCAANSGTGL
jgi:ZPR1 zinc-finger domain